MKKLDTFQKYLVEEFYDDYREKLDFQPDAKLGQFGRQVTQANIFTDCTAVTTTTNASNNLTVRILQQRQCSRTAHINLTKRGHIKQPDSLSDGLMFLPNLLKIGWLEPTPSFLVGASLPPRK